MLSTLPDQICDIPTSGFPTARRYLGAQNLYWESEGAFTGEISVNMLQACNVKWVIVGHSERRTLFNETDEIVCRKALFALKNSMSVTFVLVNL